MQLAPRLTVAYAAEAQRLPTSSASRMMLAIRFILSPCDTIFKRHAISRLKLACCSLRWSLGFLCPSAKERDLKGRFHQGTSDPPRGRGQESSIRQQAPAPITCTFPLGCITWTAQERQGIKGVNDPQCLHRPPRVFHGSADQGLSMGPFTPPASLGECVPAGGGDDR